MKQGLIIRIEKKFIIIKTENSKIERLKKRENVVVGDLIDFEKKDIYRGFGTMNYKKIVASFPILIIILSLSVFLLVQSSDDKVHGVVSLDVNPSIQFSINKKGNVIKVEDFSYVEKLDLEVYIGMQIDDATQYMIDELKKYKFINDDDSIIISFVEIESKKNDNRTIITNMIKKQIVNYRVIFINGDVNKLDRSNDDSKTLGRKIIEEMLNINSIEVNIDNDYIRNAIDELIDKDSPKGSIININAKDYGVTLIEMDDNFTEKLFKEETSTNIIDKNIIQAKSSDSRLNEEKDDYKPDSFSESVDNETSDTEEESTSDAVEEESTSDAVEEESTSATVEEESTSATVEEESTSDTVEDESTSDTVEEESTSDTVEEESTSDTDSDESNSVKSEDQADTQTKVIDPAIVLLLDQIRITLLSYTYYEHDVNEYIKELDNKMNDEGTDLSSITNKGNELIGKIEDYVFVRAELEDLISVLSSQTYFQNEANHLIDEANKDLNNEKHNLVDIINRCNKSIQDDIKYTTNVITINRIIEELQIVLKKADKKETDEINQFIEDSRNKIDDEKELNGMIDQGQILINKK